MSIMLGRGKCKKAVIFFGPKGLGPKLEVQWAEIG